MIRPNRFPAVLLSVAVFMCAAAFAQEKPAVPYFITYDHYLEEPGSLEIQVSPVFGRAPDLHSFTGFLNEFEYGVNKWWTTEVYLDWQHTSHEGSLYTGFRFENRFKPFQEKHWINPVFYIEYEQLTGGDKTLKEIVGFDSKEDLQIPNEIAREDHEKEIETKLILSSDAGDWNIAGNLIGAKNLNEGRWEFGYALGVSRPLASPTGTRCTFCRERFSAGLELYGGLGEWGEVTFNGTSQYIAPVFLWKLPSETVIRVSPGWGITDESVRTLFRVGVSQEIDGIGQRIARIFHKH